MTSGIDGPSLNDCIIHKRKGVMISVTIRRIGENNDITNITNMIKIVISIKHNIIYYSIKE